MNPWWDGNHLFDGELFVHPGYQKQGIASALFRKLLTEAVQKYDAKVFDAHTFSRSEHPLAWYRKLGFKQTEEWTMISGSVPEILRNL